MSHRKGLRGEELEDAPKTVPVRLTHASDGIRFQGGHDGWVQTHGLTHARTLELTFDGRAIAGEDMLLCLDDRDKKRFDRAMDAHKLEGIPYQIRFHLHPEIEAHLDMGGTAVSLALKSGEVWVFRHDGRQEMTLEPSVWKASKPTFFWIAPNRIIGWELIAGSSRSSRFTGSSGYSVASRSSGSTFYVRWEGHDDVSSPANSLE